MSALTNNTVASTYQSLLKTVDNGVVGSTLKNITDGFGNPTALSLDDQAIFISGTLEVTAGVKGLFFRNETSPTFQNTITSRENIFNHGDLLVQPTTQFVIEKTAEYYALGDVTNSGSLIVSGTLIVGGGLLNYGPIILASGSGHIL